MKLKAKLSTGLLICLTTIVVAQAVNVKIYNKGVPGETCGEGLKRFSRSIAPLKPDWLIIYYGINDSLFTQKMVSPEKFAKNMQKLIDQAQAGKVKHIILVSINPIIEEIVKKRKLKHPHKDNLNAFVEKFDRQVRKIAKDNKLPMFDLRKTIIENGGVKSKLIRNNWNDGLHLTPAGYKLMAQGIYELIAPEVKDGETIVCLGDSITYGAHTKGQGTVQGESYPAQLNSLLSRKK